MRLLPLSSRITARVAEPTVNVIQLVMPFRIEVAMAHRSPHRTDTIDLEPEQFGQLADQYGQRNAVHVAVADRLGKQLGDEAETCQAGDDAYHTRHHGHHAGQGDGPHRVAAGQRQDNGEDDRGQRGVGAQHQDAAGTEQRIGQQRDDRRVETVDARDPGRHRVRDADRNQHRRQHQSGDDVVTQPGCFVAAQGLQPRHPAHPAGLS